jgi:hypothetical protein
VRATPALALSPDAGALTALRLSHASAAEFRFDPIGTRDLASRWTAACSISAPSGGLLAPPGLLVIEEERGSRCAVGSSGTQQPVCPSQVA